MYFSAQKDTTLLLVPKSLVYSCFNSTACAMLTGKGLSAMTVPVFDGCESQASPLHSGVPAWLRGSTSPDLLLSVPLVLSHSSVTLQ